MNPKKFSCLDASDEDWDLAADRAAELVAEMIMAMSGPDPARHAVRMEEIFDVAWNDGSLRLLCSAVAGKAEGLDVD